MNDILTEKEYQHFIMDRLSQDNGYVYGYFYMINIEEIWTILYLHIFR